ncbi:MAG: LysM peptidoglycan-binding domain-containing protein [Chloroflexi bacterium]|nr:LysM peptidoglycan-binding domain-containing protein [Chloroflexota bacterium]
MRRLTLLAALVLAALIAASAWLAIVAQSDPEPLPTAEHLPRDEDQSQQQQSQAEPDPGPDDDRAEQQSSESDPSDEQATQQSQDEDSERPESVEPAPDPVDVLIAALDVPRPPIEPPPPPETTVVIEYETYVVEAGDTLADIAETMDVDLHDLIAVNELDSPDLLYIGRELTVPVELMVTAPVEPTEPTFEPVEVAPSITDAGVVYGTIRDHERGVVNSAVVAASQTDPSVRLVEACIDGERRTYIMGLPLTEGLARIYWRFDEGPLSTDRWTAGDNLVESTSWCPFLHTLDEQEGLRTLWIRIGGQDLTFGIENLMPDELLVNFAYCGR